MTFMNKKEEVLDIKLTQYGKKLLSNGEFDPVYYTFHDEGILYDSEYASFVESQNSIEGRILEKTPSTRTQHNYTSAAEKDGTIEIKNADGTIIKIDTFQISQRNALGLPLGTSKLDTQNFPAFKIKIYDGEITGTDLNYTGSLGNKIPQINCKTKARAQIRNVENVQKYDNPFGNATSPIDAKGHYVSVDVPNFLLEIVEDNTSFEVENFDIEVFISPSRDNIPLSYSSEGVKSQIVSGILISNDLDPDETFATPTNTSVEYYFDVITDNDILPDVVAAANSKFKSKGFYNDSLPNYTKERTTLSISDIYSSTTGVEDIEDCE